MPNPDHFETVMERPRTPRRGEDAYFDRQGADTNRGLITPTARQRYEDGRLGPMNINPRPIPMDRRATGGLVPMPPMNRPAGFSAKIDQPSSSNGLIASTVPGRTDQHHKRVRPGSFVIPADVVSGVGQGNTLAGAKLLVEALKTGPYGAAMPKAKTSGGMGIPRPPRPPRFAEGGEVPETDILAAGGEMILEPEEVAAIGGGDLQAGHKHLLNMVKTVRAQTINQLKALPGPRR